MKYNSVLVFVVQKGSSIPSMVQADDAAPSWMELAISSLRSLDSETNQQAPPSPSRSPARSKLKVTSIFDCCCSTIDGELTKAEKETSQAVFSDMLMVLNGQKYHGMHIWLERRGRYD